MQVKIIPPDAKLPDQFEILDVKKPEIPAEQEEITVVDIGEEIDAELANTPDEYGEVQ